jgi:hypothetical protein
MSISEAILWPGTKVCEHFGVNPEGEAALIRWLVNTLVYLTVSLIVVWAIMA